MKNLIKSDRPGLTGVSATAIPNRIIVRRGPSDNDFLQSDRPGLTGVSATATAGYTKQNHCQTGTARQ